LQLEHWGFAPSARSAAAAGNAARGLGTPGEFAATLVISEMKKLANILTMVDG